MDEDRIEGKAKEIGGAVTGDDELKREGEAQGAWGRAKDAAGDAIDKAKDAADEAVDSIQRRT
jgi:uncharacterized protein YjbJ (UPF0337 family)